MTKLIPACALGLALFTSLAGAAEPTDKHDHVRSDDWGFDLGIGFARVDTPVPEKDELTSFVLPQWYYYGERFYVETTEVGFTLYESERWMFDLVGYLNQDGILFNTNGDALSFVEISKFLPNVGVGAPLLGGKVPLKNIERDFTYMAGAQFYWLTDRLEVKAGWAKDVTAGHNGEEIFLALQRSYFFEQWKLNWEFGAIGKTAALNNYYFGLRKQETGLRKDSLPVDKLLPDYYVKFATAYRISAQVSAVVSLHYTWKPAELSISPLLQKRGYMGGFIGVNIHL